MGELRFTDVDKFLSEREGTLKAIHDMVETWRFIERIAIENNVLVFHYTDGARGELWDDGQQCCETRYMHSDDNLDDFAHCSIQDIVLRDGPTETGGEYDVLDSAFMIVTTSKGEFTVVNYNEHNGYYGGFQIAAKFVREN